MSNITLSYMWDVTHASKGKLSLLQKVFPTMSVSKLAELVSCFHWSQKKSIREATRDMPPCQIIALFRECNSSPCSNT